MKKVIAILVLLAFIVACAPEPSSYEREEGAVKAPVEPKEAAKPLPAQEVKEVGRTPPAITPPSEKIDYSLPEEKETVEAEAAPVKKKLDPAIKDLIDRSENKVNNYAFLYKGPESNNVAKDTYYLFFKDGQLNKMKIKKYEEDNYIRANESTHMYIDVAGKSVVGCCEVLSRCISGNVDNTKKNFSFDYADFTGKMPKMPHQWLRDIPEGAVVKGTETREAKTVTTITYTKDGKDYEMKLNSNYGLPQIVTVRSGENIVAAYEFNDFVFNGNKESDFKAPCKS